MKEVKIRDILFIFHSEQKVNKREYGNLRLRDSRFASLYFLVAGVLQACSISVQIESH